MKGKKILAFVLTVSIVLSVFFVFSINKSNAAANAKTQVTFWHLFTGGDGPIMMDIVKKFNSENKNIEIKAVTQEWAQFYTKLQVAIASGNAPDLAISHTSRLPELVDKKIVYPLDIYAASIGLKWNIFYPNVVKTVEFNGQHYAIPLDIHPHIMYYNKTLLKKMGLLNKDGKPNIPPGPNGFINFLSQIKAKAPKGVITMALPSAGEDIYRTWWALYNQLGGPGLIDKSGKKVIINNEQGKKAAEYLLSLYTKGLVPRNIQNSYQLFQSGKAVLLPTGVWFTAQLEITKGFEFGSMPFPKIFDKPATWADSHTFIIPLQKKGKNDNKIKAALTFAKWTVEHGWLWSRAGHLPTVMKVAGSPEFKKLPYRDEYAKAAEQAVFLPQTTKTWAIKDALIQALDAVWAGRMSVADGLSKAVKDMEKILAR